MNRSRRSPEYFALPIDDIRDGKFSDKYFVRAREILLADGHDPQITMQFFCRTASLLAGMDEALAILSRTSFTPERLTVSALHDGDRVEPWETVLLVQGPATAFIHLETVVLGVLARGTRIATQTRAAVDAARGKDVLYFPARHDHYLLQTSDGLAAHIGGAAAVSTDAQGLLWDTQGSGTIPHALIAAYGGDTVTATQRFFDHVGDSVPVVALVDFDNDCVGTSLAVAQRLGDSLAAVRLDTSASLIDATFAGEDEHDALRGVNPELVRRVRAALDQNGYQHVRIVVSGGFNADRITAFEAEDVPVDAYGVGSSLLANSGRFDFTADIVEVDGAPCAKAGRALAPNPRLETVALA